MRQKLSLAATTLLGSFAFGCDGPTPAGLPVPEEPLLSQAGSRAYTYSHAGDLATDPEDGAGGANAGKKGSQEVVMGSSRKGEALVLTTLAASFVSGAACFPARAQFAGVLSPDGSTVTGTYYIDGFSGDGGTAIKYVLRVEGTVMSGTFPPPEGGTAVVEWRGAGAGRMGTEGRSRGACIGSLDVHGAVSVTRVD